ncbi:MAG TPA: hypothetical protein VGQ00_03785 [Candidatus Norongarragalinales archaeon]|jgi:hypothetical protein|nr:hypothetical protein [Candidatus Norongarragalinales archaeon]
MRRGQYAEGEPTGRYFESAIPIILFAILAIFVAAKFGVINLSGVPVIGGLFPASVIKVAVIGQASPGLEGYLRSDDYRAKGVVFFTLRPDDIYKDLLNNYDIIILQGDQYCKRITRDEIANRVKAGAGLVVVQDACTRVRGDPSVLGWGLGPLGDVMPATYGGVTAEPELPNREFVQGKVTIIQFDHPIFGGVKNFFFNGRVVPVNPAPNSQPLALIDLGSTNAPSVFAIIEKPSVVGGKAVYYAFDPGSTSKEMMLNTLLYLKGRKQ